MNCGVTLGDGVVTVEDAFTRDAKNFFYSSFFNFFSVSLLIAISLRGSVARIYESKKNTNNNRDYYNDKTFF